MMHLIMILIRSFSIRLQAKNYKLNKETNKIEMALSLQDFVSFKKKSVKNLF